MRGVLATVGVAGCGLVLLGPQAVLRPAAQEAASERTLIERLRQIQAEIARPEPAAEATPSAEELIQDIQVIERQLRSDADGQRPALSEEEVRSLVREGLGVEVLKAETVERDGRQVYALTVMNPPGDYNGAFMVRTLLVDRTTGGLLGEVPHTPRTATTDVAPSAPAAGPVGGGLEIRRRTHR
jgi:uncharacterized membrane protein YkoI